MVSSLAYQKLKIDESLKELYDLTGRQYEVIRLESGLIKLRDCHKMFSNGIQANNYREFRYLLNDIVQMMKLSNNWYCAQLKHPYNEVLE